MIASYSDHVEREHLCAPLVAKLRGLRVWQRRNLALTRRSYRLASRSQSGSGRDGGPLPGEQPARAPAAQ